VSLGATAAARVKVDILSINGANNILASSSISVWVRRNWLSDLVLEKSVLLDITSKRRMEDYVIMAVSRVVLVGWRVLCCMRIELGMTCYRLIENISTGVSTREYLQTLLDIKEGRWG